MLSRSIFIMEIDSTLNEKSTLLNWLKKFCNQFFKIFSIFFKHRRCFAVNLHAVVLAEIPYNIIRRDTLKLLRMQSGFPSLINVFVTLLTLVGSYIRGIFIERLRQANVNGWQE